MVRRQELEAGVGYKGVILTPRPCASAKGLPRARAALYRATLYITGLDMVHATLDQA